VLERRRLMRKLEEEKEIDWKLSGKVDEKEMKSKVKSLLSKLKVHFSEEKDARRSIVKPNRSYYNFFLYSFSTRVPANHPPESIQLK
jgi:hypothetical protein